MKERKVCADARGIQSINAGLCNDVHNGEPLIRVYPRKSAAK